MKDVCLHLPHHVLGDQTSFYGDCVFWQSLFGYPEPFPVIAYVVRRLPHMVRAAAAGLRQTSVTLEEAAANLGAPPMFMIRKITAPLIAANLIAGVLLAFSFSMLEVSDSLLLAQKIEYYPITSSSA